MPRTLSDRTARLAGGILFAVLLTVGIVQSIGDAATVAAAVVFGGWYLVSLRLDERNDTQTRLWLVVLLLGWATLIALSPAFVWLAFLLTVLTWHVLPWKAALPLVLTIAAGSVASFAWHHDQLQAAAVLGPVIGIATAVAITEVYHQIRRQSEQLIRVQKELSAREHEAGQLYERERLGRELHDTVAQSLTSITMLLRSALTHTPETHPHRRQLDVALDTAQDALAQTRGFIRGFATTDGATLPEAILSAAERTRQLGLPVTVEQQEWNRPLSVPHKVALLRVTQEALANAVRHASASHVLVRLAVTDTCAEVSISDDGCGFDPASMKVPRPDGSGYGLAGLTSRIEEQGGTLTVTSQAGTGSTVTARIPIEAP